MNSRVERLRLWQFGDLPAVRVRAAKKAESTSPRWVYLHVSLSEFRTAILPDILEEFDAMLELRRAQHLSIMGSEGLARAWQAPGLAFGDVILPNVTLWVHPLETLPEGMSGVLGLDVLRRVGAIINLREGWLTIHAEEPMPA